jgi:hypothetical protein
MLTGRLAYACLLTSRQNIVFLSTRSSQVAVNRPRHFLSSLQLQARHIMSATSDEDVRSTLRQLLPNVDMDTTSERKVDMGCSCPANSCARLASDLEHATPTGQPCALLAGCPSQQLLSKAQALSTTAAACRSVRCLLSSWAQPWTLIRS